MTKKFLKSILTLSIITLPICWICFWKIRDWWDWEDHTFDFPYAKEYTSDPNTNLENEIDIDKKYGEKSILTRLLKVFWLNTTAFDWDHKFLNYVRAILNMALWLLSMIALIMIIYTFYLMFFTENDAWVKKAKWNLVGIFIALVIIWLAWLIVSFIFRWYQKNWKENESKISGNETSMNYEANNDNQIYLTI